MDEKMFSDKLAATEVSRVLNNVGCLYKNDISEISNHARIKKIAKNITL